MLEPMAGKIIHCGDSGAGQAAKLCNNMLLAVQQIAVGEAFVLAEKLGLSAQSLFDVVTGATGNCWAVHQLSGARAGSDVAGQQRVQAGFATALMNKDLGLAMDAVASSGASAHWAATRRRSNGLRRGARRPGLPARSSRPCASPWREQNEKYPLC